MSNTLVQYLDGHKLSYNTLKHPHTASSLSTARVSNINGNEMAKSVILEDEQGYVMAVVPATRHVKIRELNMLLNRNLRLASETELKDLFNDCELGAIPPVGQAYGLTTVVDYSLDDCNNVYLEAGNHEDVLHVTCSTFHELMKNTEHASICSH